jgi:hypothetical protein
MTDRIEAIAKKCRAENWERADLDYAQFAKMIIEECANIADDNYDKGMCPVGGFVLEHFYGKK